MESMGEKNLRSQGRYSATESHRYRLLPVPWEEMPAQIGVLLTRQTKADILHVRFLSSRASHSSTSMTWVSMQS